MRTQFGFDFSFASLARNSLHRMEEWKAFSLPLKEERISPYVSKNWAFPSLEMDQQVLPSGLRAGSFLPASQNPPREEIWRRQALEEWACIRRTGR